MKHHIGSGRRTVIPTDWAEHHRPVVHATHGATITLRRPGGIKGAFNPSTGKYDFTPHPVYYEGPARIQVMATQDQAAVVGGQEVTTLAYAVQLTHDVDAIHLEDIAAVSDMDDNGDLDLVARELIVRSFESGSLHWERRLICTLNLETQGT